MGRTSLYIIAGLLLTSCSDYFRNDYQDNSPTSGKLKVYYDEGLRLHVRNQTRTFESQYADASVQLFETSESEAVQALYHDSCQAIVIARYLNSEELKMFAAQQYTPSYSIVAYTGVAVIVNARDPLRLVNAEDLTSFLSGSKSLADSNGKDLQMQVLFDRNNSGVLHYMLDSVLHSKKLPAFCSVLGGSLESINYVANHPNSMALVDFAWLSDQDDSIRKVYEGRIRFLSLARKGANVYEYPSQSSFKLGTYPFIRYVHVIRKAGDFSLAKGYESFIMGPKGQTIFLKQGLMPGKQAERSISVKMGGGNGSANN